MQELVYDLYSYLFARKTFNKLNKFIFLLGLRGLGILNYKSDKQSGETNFAMSHFSNAKKGVIFDVGANVGNYSTSLRELNQHIEIYCFEPHPCTYQKLLSTVNHLKIKTFNVGVGSTAGMLKLYDYALDDGSEHASLYKDVIEKIHQGESVEHEVEIVTLNAFAIEHKIERVLLLKIDTEGHELEVLKGFEPYIRQNRVELIHFEFNEMNVASRVFFKDFWEFLPNYDFYRMVQDGLIPIKNYNPVYCEIFAYQNIVAKLKTEFKKN
ncbi:MAG: FkbM family methyltransferase [Methylobacter sp.]